MRLKHLSLVAVLMIVLASAAQAELRGPLDRTPVGEPRHRADIPREFYDQRNLSPDSARLFGDVGDTLGRTMRAPAAQRSNRDAQRPRASSRMQAGTTQAERPRRQAQRNSQSGSRGIGQISGAVQDSIRPDRQMAGVQQPRRQSARAEQLQNGGGQISASQSRAEQQRIRQTQAQEERMEQQRLRQEQIARQRLQQEAARQDRLERQRLEQQRARERAAAGVNLSQAVRLPPAQRLDGAVGTQAQQARAQIENGRPISASAERRAAREAERRAEREERRLGLNNRANGLQLVPGSSSGAQPVTIDNRGQVNLSGTAQPPVDQTLVRQMNDSVSANEQFLRSMQRQIENSIGPAFNTQAQTLQ